MSTSGPRALTFCPGCRRQDIPRHRFACRPCWYRLPADLRREISANYRSNPVVHRQAIRDGLRWFRDNPTAALASPAPAPCWCIACEHLTVRARTEAGDPLSMFARRFIVCPDCGNKRCPRATHHDLPCTGSNEPGQPGSAYEQVVAPPVSAEELRAQILDQPAPRDRYAQCDDTCTVDCGACKGAGRPAPQGGGQQ